MTPTGKSELAWSTRTVARLLAALTFPDHSPHHPKGLGRAQLCSSTFESSVYANATLIETSALLRWIATPLEQHPWDHTARTVRLGSPRGVFAALPGVQP